MNYPELFSNRGDSGYIFAGGRINFGKRQHLLVESIGLTKSGAKLIVAGPPIRLKTPIGCEPQLSGSRLRTV